VTVSAGLLNGIPTVPVLIAEQVTTGGPGLMVIEQPVPTAPLASVTLIVNVPGAVGVPLMAPVEVFRVRPAGNVPLLTENVSGAVPPVTVITGLLKGTPTVPVLIAEQVTTRGGGAHCMLPGEKTLCFDLVVWLYPTECN